MSGGVEIPTKARGGLLGCLKRSGQGDMLVDVLKARACEQRFFATKGLLPERFLATILFTDIVGSTAVRSSLRAAISAASRSTKQLA